MAPRIVSIEGNIGAGKTTIFTKLQLENTDPNILFVHEPVNQWLSYRDPTTKETLLSAYYKHPQQYAFPFQITALLTRLTLLKNTIEQNPDAKLIITERSLQSDFEIFAKMLYNDQKINTILYSIYEQIYKDYVKYALNGVIYINSDPLTCFERCGLRNRDGEKVGLHYLRNCDAYHHEWLQNIGVPVLTMSSDYNQQQLFSIYGFLQRIMLQTKK